MSGNRVPEITAYEHLGISGTAGVKRVLMYGLDASGNAVAINVSASGGLGTPSTITSGRKAVTSAGTAERLVGSSTPCSWIDVCADTGNTSLVVVGDSGVVAADGSQEGLVLIPANAPLRIYIDDVYDLYVDSQTNGDAVSFAYYT